ncbi:hypothetical protein V8E53_002835 [Lactarius tabidus]
MRDLEPYHHHRKRQDDCNKLGLHPRCLHTAASVIAERELWKFADTNTRVDVTSSTSPLPLPSLTLTLQFSLALRSGLAVVARRSTSRSSSVLHGSLSCTTARPIDAPPFSPNCIHVADVARTHVTALRVCPLNFQQRCKRVLHVAGYVLWPEEIAHFRDSV